MGEGPAGLKWQWGSWGPADELIAAATATMEQVLVANVISTLTTESVRAARESVAQQVGVQGAYYSAMMDSPTTCDLCRSIDGLECAYPSDEYSRWDPPQHGRCRCLWIYVADDETGWEPDANWESTILERAKQSGALLESHTLMDLLRLHGSSNAYFQELQANEAAAGVSIRALIRAVEEALTIGGPGNAGSP